MGELSAQVRPLSALTFPDPARRGGIGKRGLDVLWPICARRGARNVPKLRRKVSKQDLFLTARYFEAGPEMCANLKIPSKLQVGFAQT